MISGASVCPMNTLAATDSVSAPLVPIRYSMTRAKPVPTASTSGDKVELQWQGSADPGAGILFYQVFRRPIAEPTAWVYRGSVNAPTFVDRGTITNGATCAYLIRAFDWHTNSSDSNQVSVTVPPAGALDPRQIGIRANGV